MSEKAGEVSTCDLVDTKHGAAKRRRRGWPEALQRQIVAETRLPGASVSVVARRHDVNANQVFKWRRQYEAGTAGSDAGLVPVELRASPTMTAPAGGTIEIELTNGTRLRLSGAVDGMALRQVLELLR